MARPNLVVFNMQTVKGVKQPPGEYSKKLISGRELLRIKIFLEEVLQKTDYLRWSEQVERGGVRMKAIVIIHCPSSDLGKV